MKSLGIGCTDIGCIRENNEDMYLIDNHLGLYAVSDGIGGYIGGEIAAVEAVTAVSEYIAKKEAILSEVRAGRMDDIVIEHLAVAAVAAACRAVFRRSVVEPQLRGMGCTLTILLVGRHRAAFAHVGDSRLYLNRRGKSRQLTRDHNMAQVVYGQNYPADSGISAKLLGCALTRSLGRAEVVDIERGMVELQPKDVFVLCSDGVSDHLHSPDELGPLLASDVFTATAERMIEYANDSGGHDNATAVVVRIDGQPGEFRIPDHSAELVPINADAPTLEDVERPGMYH